MTYKQVKDAREDCGVMILIFADDISVALRRKDEKRLQITAMLRDILRNALRKLDLEENIQKCDNFMIEMAIYKYL